MMFVTKEYIILGGVALVLLIFLLTMRLAFGGCCRWCRSLKSGSDVVGKQSMRACFHTTHGGSVHARCYFVGILR